MGSIDFLVAVPLVWLYRGWCWFVSILRYLINYKCYWFLDEISSCVKNVFFVFFNCFTVTTVVDKVLEEWS